MAVVNYNTVIAHQVEVAYRQAPNEQAAKASLIEGYPRGATVAIIAEFRTMQKALDYGFSIISGDPAS